MLDLATDGLVYLEDVVAVLKLVPRQTDAAMGTRTMMLRDQYCLRVSKGQRVRNMSAIWSWRVPKLTTYARISISGEASAIRLDCISQRKSVDCDGYSVHGYSVIDTWIGVNCRRPVSPRFRCPSYCY